MSVMSECISVNRYALTFMLKKTQERKTVSPNCVFHFALLYFLTIEKSLQSLGGNRSRLFFFQGLQIKCLIFNVCSLLS
ncbi:hypothetical protein ACRRTK_009995 [Alexandromys fortis]